MNRATKTCVPLFAVLLLAGTNEARAEWDWIIAPYIWAADVGLDSSVGGDLLVSTTVPFDDLVDKLDTAFMAHIEARSGQWGLFIDGIDLGLSDSSTTSVGPGGPILGDLTARSRLDLGLYDAGALYRIKEPTEGSVAVDLLFGARIVDMDVVSDVTLPGPGATQINLMADYSETDALIGLRVLGQFGGQWHWSLRGDVSAGGTEGSFNALGTVGYAFGQNQAVTIDLGYRYLEIEVEGKSRRGAATNSDIVFSGPLVGVIFQF